MGFNPESEFENGEGGGGRACAHACAEILKLQEIMHIPIQFW